MIGTENGDIAQHTLTTKSTTRFIRKAGTQQETDEKPLSIYKLLYSPNGDNLMFSGSGQDIQLLHGDRLEHNNVLRGHTPGILSAAYSDDGQYLATAASNGEVRIWKLTPQTVPRILTGFSHWVVTAAFNSDSSLMAVGTANGELQIWNTNGRGLIKKWRIGKGWLRAITLSPSGNTWVISSDDGYTRTVSTKAPFNISGVFSPANGRQIDASIKMHQLIRKEIVLYLLGVMHHITPLFGTRGKIIA